MNPEQCQQMLCQMSDDPEAWRRPPFADLYGACLAAKYDGDDDDDRDLMSPASTPF